MDILLNAFATLMNAFANFITEHWFLVFLILLFSPPRLFNMNMQKKDEKESKKEPKQMEEEVEIVERDNNIPPEDSH